MLWESGAVGSGGPPRRTWDPVLVILPSSFGGMPTPAKGRLLADDLPQLWNARAPSSSWPVLG
jgi:hypothetical protein